MDGIKFVQIILTLRTITADFTICFSALSVSTLGTGGVVLLHSVQTALRLSDIIKSNFSSDILFRLKLWMTLAQLTKREVQYLGTAHNVLQMPKGSTWADIHIHFSSQCFIFCCEGGILLFACLITSQVWGMFCWEACVFFSFHTFPPTLTFHLLSSISKNVFAFPLSKEQRGWEHNSWMWRKIIVSEIFTRAPQAIPSCSLHLLPPLTWL